MDKRFISACLIASSSLLSFSATAELVNVGYDDFVTHNLNIINPADGSVTAGSEITQWTFLYDNVTGIGTLSIDASFSLLGAASISNASVTTNTDGSLAVMGNLEFTDPLLGSSFFSGRMTVDVTYDDPSQVTIFTFSPLNTTGTYDGFLLQSGVYAGALLDFSVTSSPLAIIDSPFPAYSPVPLPPALLLMLSGLASLVGLQARYRRRTG